MLFLQCRLVFALLFLPSVLSVLVNVTIDDTFGDPLTGATVDYLPSNSWNLGATCDGCASSPNQSQAYGGTWHEGTFNKLGNSSSSSGALLATVPFFGNAIYVYCILSLSPASPPSDMTFFIDMEQVGSFKQSPTGQAGFQYDVLVFSNTTLGGGNHTLIIQNGHTGGQRSLMMLDYVVYSYEDGTHPSNKTSSAMPSPAEAPASATTSSSSKSRVIGAVLGTLFGLLFLALAFVAYRRYSKGQPLIPTTRSQQRSQQPSSVSRWFSGLAARIPRGHKRSSSFNPHKLVQKIRHSVMLGSTAPPRAPQPPPKPRPSFPSQPRHQPTQLPYLNHEPPQTGDRSARSSPAPLLAAAYGVPEQPHYPSGSSFSSKIESIHRWQRQTMEETRGQRLQPQPPPDMSEELASYYDDNATESRRVKTPPPPPRRYTVVNN